MKRQFKLQTFNNNNNKSTFEQKIFIDSTEEFDNYLSALFKEIKKFHFDVSLENSFIIVGGGRHPNEKTIMIEAIDENGKL